MICIVCDDSDNQTIELLRQFFEQLFFLKIIRNRIFLRLNNKYCFKIQLIALNFLNE